jgi:hypothetical protein
VPGAALAGATPEIVAVLTVKSVVFDQTPPCRTCTTPDTELDATAAVICVPLHATTVPRVLPSHTDPVPRADPKPEPEITIWAPAVADVEDRLEMKGGGLTAKLLLIGGAAA